MCARIMARIHLLHLHQFTAFEFWVNNFFPLPSNDAPISFFFSYIHETLCLFSLKNNNKKKNKKKTPFSVGCESRRCDINPEISLSAHFYFTAQMPFAKYHCHGFAESDHIIPTLIDVDINHYCKILLTLLFVVLWNSYMGHCGLKSIDFQNSMRKISTIFGQW